MGTVYLKQSKGHGICYLKKYEHRIGMHGVSSGKPYPWEVVCGCSNLLLLNSIFVE